MTALLLPPLLLVLACICISDLFYRTIPNRMVLLIVLLGVLQQLGNGHEAVPDRLIEQLLPALASGLAVLAVGLLIYLGGRIGAGDIKLLAALAIWFGSEDTLVFLVATALAGGALALGLPLLNALERQLCPPMVWLAQRFPTALSVPTTYDEHRPVGLPYGLAIVTGACICLL